MVFKQIMKGLTIIFKSKKKKMSILLSISVQNIKIWWWNFMFEDVMWNNSINVSNYIKFIFYLHIFPYFNKNMY